MALNHINLAVSNVPENQAFFEAYFGFQPLTKGGTALSVLRDESGLVLTLSNFDKATEVSYPDHFHIGFVQQSRERVDELYQRFTDDGFIIEPPRSFHGSWTFYLRTPGGLLIEVLY